MKKSKKAATRLAQPANNKTKNTKPQKLKQSELINIVGDYSEHDVELLEIASAALHAWMGIDPENRQAFVVTSNNADGFNDDGTEKGGYHFERIFDGQTTDDLFRYTLFMACVLICEPELRNNLSFMLEYAEEQAHKLLEEYHKQFITED